MRRFGIQRYVLLAVVLALGLLAEIFWLHMLTPLENRLSDAMLARHALNSKPDPDIVIVDIDEPSLRGLERRVEPAARGGNRKSEHFRTNRI